LTGADLYYLGFSSGCAFVGPRPAFLDEAQRQVNEL
jgi:hypothetical protein